MARAAAALAVGTLGLAACVTSRVLVGKVHPAILPSQVRIYLAPISTKYEEIAILQTSSKHSLSLSANDKTEVVIKRLTEEAAKLGANGILLQDITDTEDETFTGGAAAEHESNHGTISLGLSGEGLLTAKFGRGLAVYVEADQRADQLPNGARDKRHLNSDGR
jgi:hypothetical protein